MKRRKYGFIYKTHLFGRPTVRVMGADNVRRILLGEHRLVSVHWPASVRTILGSGCLSNLHDSSHKQRKKVRAEAEAPVSQGEPHSPEGFEAERCWVSASFGRPQLGPSPSQLSFPSRQEPWVWWDWGIWKGTAEGEKGLVFNILSSSGFR